MPGPATTGRSALFAVAALLPAACTSYETALERFDAVSPIGQLQADPGRPWTWRDLVGSDEENPARVARQSIRTLEEKAGGDLDRSSEVIGRLLWVADRDPSQLNRIVALRALSRLTVQLGQDVVALQALPEPASAADSERRLAALAAQAAATSPAQRPQLLAALDRFGERPLATRRQRREVIAQLSRVRRQTADPAVRGAAERALLRSVHFAVHEVFLTTVRGSSPAEVELRREAMAEVHRQVGPDSVAWLLAVTARSPDPPRPAYDQSADVLLELVRWCGQLDAERALRGHGDGPPPAQFLWDVIDAAAIPKGLRMLALEALALSLGRPVSFDDQWAREWFTEWTEERLRRRDP